MYLPSCRCFRRIYLGTDSILIWHKLIIDVYVFLSISVTETKRQCTFLNNRERIISLIKFVQYAQCYTEAKFTCPCKIQGHIHRIQIYTLVELRKFNLKLGFLNLVWMLKSTRLLKKCIHRNSHSNRHKPYYRFAISVTMITAITEKWLQWL